MKSFIKAAILVAFLSFGGWALTTKPAANRQTSEKENQKQPVRSFVSAKLRALSGEDGKSESSLGKSLEAADLTSREVQKMSRKRIARTIAEGEGAMPAFGKKLSKKEIESLAKYVRTFKQEK